MRGFNDELKGTSSILPNNDILVKNAYSLGADHAILGDEMTSIDLLTQEEILKLIRKK